MSVSSAGASSGAYTYLQSLLQQASTSGAGDAGAATSDPLTALMNEFYPSDSGGSAPSGNTSSAAPGSTPFSPATMSALITVQGQQQGSPSGLSSQVQSVFSQFDADGNGQISKSEFENAFDSGADTSKVDSLFGTLDGNGDGGVSLGELSSAAKGSAQHGHVHGGGGGGGGGSGGLSDLLSSTDAAGTTTQTVDNSDGSSTTTLTYTDGTVVTMTTPAQAADSGNDAGTQNQNGSGNNVIKQLIALQAQFLSNLAGGAASTVPVS